MASKEEDKSTKTDTSSIQESNNNIYMTKGKKNRVLAYRFLAHQLRIANCCELFTEVLIRAKKEMLVWPCGYTRRIVNYWACCLKSFEHMENAAPSIDLENCNLKVELYVGYRTLKYELDHHCRWMKKIQKEIAKMECQGQCVKAIVAFLIGKMKYNDKFLAALDANKADTYYHCAYWDRGGGIVCPNGFTTGGKETMEKAREEIEQTRNKYSYHL